jgi:small subunit ribosomal protein S7
MPRRKAAIKREILPDPLYGSERLAKFINVVMRRGKKSVAEGIVYNALVEVIKRLKKDKHMGSGKKGEKGDAGGEAEGGSSSSGGIKSKPMIYGKENLEALEKALHNIRPTVEVKSRRVGGATYQVPIEVDSERGLALAMRMLASSAKARGEKTMVLRLAAEIIDALEGRGAAVKMRDDMHRMAKANQAFAHYHW